MASKGTKAAPEEVLKRIWCNCKDELCTFFQHATAYSKQLGPDWLVHEATWESQSDLS